LNQLLGFEDLISVGDSNIRDRFDFTDNSLEEKEYTDSVPVARDVETGEVVWVPLTDKTRVFLCAKSGEGKTVLGKAFLSRVADMGGSIFAGTDIKNDFQSFDYQHGVSKELIDATQGLLGFEKPKVEDRDFKSDFAKRLAIPYFMREFYDANPRNVGELFSIGFQDISQNDFEGLIEVDSWRSDSQVEVMRDILSQESVNELTWDYLFRTIDDVAGQSASKLKRKLRPFKNNDVIGSKGLGLDNVVDFDDVSLVSLGLKGIDYADDSMIDFYSALSHRMFLEKAKDGVFDGPVVLYDDEAHEVLPSDRDTMTKSEVALAFSRKGRQAGLVTVLSTQEPHKIPSQQDKGSEDFVSPTSHAFVGRGLSWPGYRTVFSAFSIYNSNDTQPLRDLKDELGEHQFLYIDESMDSVYDVKIVESLAPLVNHGG